jgi:ADP-heptose:LPS heptosyltransferase
MPPHLNYLEAKETWPSTVLWIRTDSIGDNILASWQLPCLKELYIGARIIVVCQEHIAEIYKNCPGVDCVLTFDRTQALESRVYKNRLLRVVLKAGLPFIKVHQVHPTVADLCLMALRVLSDHMPSIQRILPLTRLRRALQSEGYRNGLVRRIQSLKPDIVLNSMVSRDPLSDFLSFNSGAKEKVALATGHEPSDTISHGARETKYTRLVTSRGGPCHELEKGHDFLKGLGISINSIHPKLWVSDSDEAFAIEYFSKHGLTNEKTIALFPGALHYHKIYEEYETVLEHFSDFRVVLVGGRSEAAQVGSIRQRFKGRVFDLVGKTTLCQLGSCLRRCRVLLGSDSAGAHIACAVGIPNVVIIGGGHFGRFFPYSPLTSLVCLPLECYGCGWSCRYKRPYCVKDISPRVVGLALRETLSKQSTRPRIYVQTHTLWQPAVNLPRWKGIGDLFEPDTVDIIAVPVPGC